MKLTKASFKNPDTLNETYVSLNNFSFPFSFPFRAFLFRPRADWKYGSDFKNNNHFY